MQEHQRFGRIFKSRIQYRYKLPGVLRRGGNTEKRKQLKYQVIYGRRGTGKTHLLKALQESLLEPANKKSRLN